MEYDKIIVGAGIYGLYAAEFCGRLGQKVLVIECDPSPFGRATYVNQARVHLGYHYPRSASTALKSRKYYDRFVSDFGFCIKKDFLKIYATSARQSWTNAQQFSKFCQSIGIKCLATDPASYFNPGMCDGVFETEELTYDATLLRDHFLSRIASHGGVALRFDSRIQSIERTGNKYAIALEDGSIHTTGFLLNTTYGSINQILRLVDLEPMKIKYELCEILLCKANGPLENLGITVMDGPFFSIMPFGKTGLHSLTTVAHTPHLSCHDTFPTFPCQSTLADGSCTPERLGNCNSCPVRPHTAWQYMSALARKYLNDTMRFEYHSSLFSVKPILQTSEIDDSRPTMVRVYGSDPTFVSTLSGKINTVYDLDEVLA
jgi:hypothetical protein